LRTRDRDRDRGRGRGRGQGTGRGREWRTVGWASRTAPRGADMTGTPSYAPSTEPSDRVLGVLGTSRKPDERRLPIHPAHLGRIDETLRRRIVLEAGYGEPFGVDDAALAPLVGRIAPRARVIAESDVVLLPKPQ